MPRTEPCRQALSPGKQGDGLRWTAHMSPGEQRPPQANRPIESEREEVYAKMSAIARYRGTSTRKEKAKRLWLKVVMVLAVALASIAVVAVQAQAGSFDHRPPDQVLFKGTQSLQTGNAYSFEWHFYDNGSWRVRHYSYSPYEHNWPSAAVVKAGSRLRIKVDKPQRPTHFRIYAYKRLVAEGGEGWPAGTPQLVQHSYGPVVRDGKTVGWNVFFHVNESSRQYYLQVNESWDSVPNTHISYGDATMFFHVKTS